MTVDSSDELSRLLRTIGKLAAVLAFLLLMGTLAFMYAGNEDFEEAFYRAFGSFTTTQLFAEPPSSRERGVAATLTLVGGLFYIAVLLSAVHRFGPRIIQRELDRRRQRDKENRMEPFEGHCIVCGYGNVGNAVVRALVARGERVVVIDKKPDNISAAEAFIGPDGERGRVRAEKGEASDKETLLRAGIVSAKALVACVGTDAENVYILLAAHQANSDIRLAARASDATHKKRFETLLDESLLKVVTPYESAGIALAECVAGDLVGAPS